MKFFLALPIATAAVMAIAADTPVAELSNLTATAILGWYAWHTATRTLPKLVDDFRTELAAERTLHRADRDAFFAEIDHERDQRHTDNAAIVTAVHDLAASLNRFNPARGP